MRSKTKPTASKEVAKPALLPKLRFSEFRGAGLRSVQLGDVTEEGKRRNGKKHSVAAVMGVTKADGIVPMEARLIAADIERYKLVENDWFAYNPMRLNIGSIARWKGGREILVSPDYVVFKCITVDESGMAPSYFDHFRQSKAWEDFVTEGGDGGVRVRIYYKDIARLQLALPSLPEQQKIAKCLSSVGELIAAQARKVDALKTHKKGLMQQLFPREGETQPRLRFAEFQNAGDWVQKTVGDVSEVLMCKRIFAEETNTNEGVPFYKIGTLGGAADAFISKEKFEDYKSRYNYPEKGEILITCSGTVGKCFPFNGKDAYFQDSNIVWLDNPTGEVSNEFLLMLLSNVNWGKLNSTTITRIYGPDLRGLAIKYPQDETEQQRIASCVSSLDALITAENQKLKALKTQKKGLMQQLFPSAEGVEA